MTQIVTDPDRPSAPDLGFALIRIVAGLTIAYHGYPKLVNGVAGLANSVIPKIGLPAPLLWAYAVMVVEVAGGLLLAAGLLTRLAGIALTIEFLVIVFIVKFANGFIAFAPSAIQPGFAGMVPGGFEFEFLLGIICLACVISGAGAYSVDGWIRNRRA
jgi:putative oxidoreductase